MTASPVQGARVPRHLVPRQTDGRSASTPGPRGDGRRIAVALHGLVVPLSTVEIHPRNPRIGDVTAIAASLRRFGQQKPIVVQASTRYVVAGNHLVRAARALGWTEIAANVEELDDASAVAFMLADNRTADLGGYDDELLAAILAEQTAAGNLAATGYDADDVAAILRGAGAAVGGDPDAAPEMPTEAALYVHAGELWALGAHRLLVGDSTDAAAGRAPNRMGRRSTSSGRTRHTGSATSARPGQLFGSPTTTSARPPPVVSSRMRSASRHSGPAVHSIVPRPAARSISRSSSPFATRASRSTRHWCG